MRSIDKYPSGFKIRVFRARRRRAVSSTVSSTRTKRVRNVPRERASGSASRVGLGIEIFKLYFTGGLVSGSETKSPAKFNVKLK